MFGLVGQFDLLKEPLLSLFINLCINVWVISMLIFDQCLCEILISLVTYKITPNPNLDQDPDLWHSHAENLYYVPIQSPLA